jgi:hypothetical protein
MPWDWDKVAFKYRRSVDAEEANARARIQKEIAAKKREQEQRLPKPRTKGGPL